MLINEAYQLHQKNKDKNKLDLFVELNNLGNVYFSQNKYDASESVFRDVYSKRKERFGERHPHTIRSLNNLGTIHRVQGEYERARPFAVNATRLGKEVLGSSHPDALFYSLNLCRLRAREGDVDGAVRQLREVDTALIEWLGVQIRTTVEARIRRLLLNAQEQFQNLVFTLAADHPNINTARLAADTMLRWKRVEGEEEARFAALSRRASNPEIRQLAKQVADLRAKYALALNTGQTQGASHVRRQLEATELELSGASEEFSSAQRNRRATIDDVKDILDRDSGVIQFRIYRRWISKDGNQELWRPDRIENEPYRWAATFVDAEGNIAFKDLGTLGRSTSDLHRLGSGHIGVGHKLYSQFFGPFQSHLEDLQKLFVAPDSFLSITPIDLFQRAEGIMLVSDQRLQIRIVATGRDLLERPQTQIRLEDEPSIGLLALGGIDFGEEKTNKAALDVKSIDAVARAVNAHPLAKGLPAFSDLPFTVEEVLQIGEYYGQRTSETVEVVGMHSTGVPATEKALKQLQEAPRVLHFATHGFYLPQTSAAVHRPMALSGLALNSANSGRTGDLDAQGEDGILYAIEAAGLSLDQTELVILSACDSGQGVIDYSEGVYGLVRAFKIAGARNILITLSPIPDREAKDFIVNLYENWLGHSDRRPSIGEALRQTKMEFINHENRSLRHPTVWSPWVLIEGT